MTRPQLHPVVGGLDWSFGTIAVFFTYSDAVDFIRDEKRGDLFLDCSFDDERSRYRPAERDRAAEYREWVANINRRRAA